MSRIDWTPMRVAVGILRYHGVSVCVGGESAFAYFNSLFIDYDDSQGPTFELVVPDEWYAAAPGLLCTSGLFMPMLTAPDSEEFDCGWRSLHNMPHIKTTGWTSSSSQVAIVPSSRAGIDPEDPNVFIDIYDGVTDSNFAACLDLQGLSRDAIKYLPWPRLPVLMRSLPKRLTKPEAGGKGCDGDDGSEESLLVAEDGRPAISELIEDLVDGMNITLEWVYRHLNIQDPELAVRVRTAVNSRFDRLDWLEEGNKITRAIKDSQQAEQIAMIPGYN